MPAAPDRAERLSGLDALRGLAVVVVVAFHYGARLGALWPGHPYATGQDWCCIGDLGVHLFFVISGYVIALTVARSPGPADFAVARASRLYPAYWTCVLITALALWCWPVPGRSVGPAAVLANLSMVHGFFGVPDVDGVYWSLLVELHFYVFAGIALLLPLRWRRLEWWLAAWLAAVAAQQALAAAGIGGRPVRAVGVLLIAAHAPWFAAGVALRAGHTGILRHATWPLLGAAFALISWREAWHHALAAAISFAAVAGGARMSLRGIWWRPALALGAISYPVYLLHQNIGYAVMLPAGEAGWPRWLAVAAAVLVTALLAAAVTLLVERPALAAIRARWRGLRKGPAPAPATG